MDGGLEQNDSAIAGKNIEKLSGWVMATVYQKVFTSVGESRERLLTLQNCDLLTVFYMLDCSFMLNFKTQDGVWLQKKKDFFSPLYTKITI